MENYSTLYRIKVVHDYFDGCPCPALQCRLTLQGETLARRRGLLFRQTAADEWALLFLAAPPVDDVLTLDLLLADPSFTLYTAWKDFQPSAAYILELPLPDEKVDAATAIRSANTKRGIGRGFCTMALRLTEAMTNAAKANKPMQTVLHFHAPSLRWEYLFILRGETDVPASRMTLEDATGRLEFTALEECEAYGKKAIRTTSMSFVPMRQGYGCRLRLMAKDEGRQKRVLLKQVPPPEPGRFLDACDGILRQICYY